MSKEPAFGEKRQVRGGAWAGTGLGHQPASLQSGQLRRGQAGPRSGREACRPGHGSRAGCRGPSLWLWKVCGSVCGVADGACRPRAARDVRAGLDLGLPGVHSPLPLQAPSRTVPAHGDSPGGETGLWEGCSLWGPCWGGTQWSQARGAGVGYSDLVWPVAGPPEGHPSHTVKTDDLGTSCLLSACVLGVRTWPHARGGRAGGSGAEAQARPAPSFLLQGDLGLVLFLTPQRTMQA